VLKISGRALTNAASIASRQKSPVWTTSRNREIRDQDVQGLKCLRRIGPLLSRLRKVGTERDRAGNRRLFMDQYCALILMSLFSPAIESLRDLQRACALDKVRKRLGVNRASLGSLSESVAIFDPALLKEIAIELGHTIRSKPNSQFAAVGQPITAVDGTLIATVKRVAELSWTPKAKGKHLSAYRLHTPFEVLSGKAVRIDATSAAPTGDADERALLQRTIEADRCYVLDRGSIGYQLAAAHLRQEPSEGLPMPSSGLWAQAQPRPIRLRRIGARRSAADMQSVEAWKAILFGTAVAGPVFPHLTWLGAPP